MSIFDNGGKQNFKYERFILVNDEYVSAGFISDFVESCSIDVNFSRNIVSSANFRVNNSVEINYLSDLIKPWLVFNGYEIPFGLYMLQSPTTEFDGVTATRDIQGYDLSLALEQDTIITSYTFLAGTNVIDNVELILDSVGDWLQYQIEPSTQVLAETISFDVGTSKLTVVNELLKLINYYPMWVNGKGVFTAIPWSSDPNVSFEFLDNDVSLYKADVNLNVDYSTLFNRVLCIGNRLGENTAMLSSVWTLEDENLSEHPLSYTNIGRYITKIVNIEAISQEYLDIIARKELREILEIEESIDYTHAFVTSRLDDGIAWNGDCFRFRNIDLGVDAIYKIFSQIFNLTTGLIVTSTIKRIKDVF